MKIGVVAYRYDNYAYRRNIVDIVPDIQYQKAKDLFARINAGTRILNRIARREIISTFDLNNQFFDFNFNKVDLLHLFNGISYGRTPWVSTFETILPRFSSIINFTREPPPGFITDWKLRRAFEALAGPSCKRIIAISGCTANIQRALLEKFSSYKESIEDKLVIMHPPQDILVSRFEDKQIDLENPIRFMFVGNAFFRKGGFEILDTFKLLREKYHYSLELIIISDIRTNGYAVPEDVNSIKMVKNILKKSPDWLKYYHQLPNPEVLSLMKKTHIGLLPTYADTYGYSVLEFQASGCPVITTNIRALPEINNNDRGWMINIPKNRLGEAIYTTDEDRRMISKAIIAGLEKIVHEIYHDRSVIHEKSNKSIVNIKSNYSVMNYSIQMKKIYQDAIGEFRL